MSSADSRASSSPRVRVAAGFAVRWAIAAVLSVVVAALAGTLALRLTMAPPMSDLRSFVIFLGLTGGATLILGSAVLAFLERVVPLSVRAKAFLAVAIGSAVALLNVYVVARLMFISDEHDLPYLFAALVFAGGATMFFSYNAANAMTERVTRIAVAVRDLADGRYDRRVSLEGNDEVAALGRTVDRLAERLRDAEEQRARLDRERRELTAAISHDLRTPLASVRAMAEALADGVVDDPAEEQRYYATMNREIERLTRMIDDLFELARIDADALVLQRQSLALQDVAAEVVDAMQASASRRGIELTAQLDPAAPPLSLDGARIERAVGNLVRNALEHTPAGGHVRVRVHSVGSAVALEVEDDGEGIEPAHLARVWERFYRSDASRQRAAGAENDGAGLGLAIVRGIVEVHGGDVDVTSAPGAGATFTLRLPCEDGSTSR